MADPLSRRADFRPQNSGKKNQRDVPPGFTLSLALMDAVPVALFAASAIVAAGRIHSPLLLAGAVACLAAGAGKVAWKLAMALAHRDVPALSHQMRYLMPVGFLLMLVGAVTSATDTLVLLRGLASVPSLVPLALWLVCTGLMAHFARHRDQLDARSNWVEQGVNSVGQLALLVALVLV